MKFLFSTAQPETGLIYSRHWARMSGHEFTRAKNVKVRAALAAEVGFSTVEEPTSRNNTFADKHLTSAPEGGTCTSITGTDKSVPDNRTHWDAAV